MKDFIVQQKRVNVILVVVTIVLFVYALFLTFVWVNYLNLQAASEETLAAKLIDLDTRVMSLETK